MLSKAVRDYLGDSKFDPDNMLTHEQDALLCAEFSLVVNTLNEDKPGWFHQLNTDPDFFALNHHERCVFGQLYQYDENGKYLGYSKTLDHLFGFHPLITCPEGAIKEPAYRGWRDIVEILRAEDTNGSVIPATTDS